MFSFNKQQYVPLEDESGEGLQTRAPYREGFFKRYVPPSILVVLCFIAGALGFLVTQHFSKSVFDESGLGYIPLNTIAHTFQYNITFTDSPNDQSDAAWRSLIPEGGGFFAHPDDDNARSTFSVYHQLHCLDGIRYGYYVNREAAIQGKRLPDEHLPWDLQAHHMRHCIDMIRQALMCNADTTIEIVDEVIDSVHGFRTEHQCKDWQQLWDWTTMRQRSKPEVANRPEIRLGTSHSHHDGK